jgi:hypothetical protein
MPSSKIIDELIQKPRRDIEADLARVSALRARLQEEERFLEGLLSFASLQQLPEDTGQLRIKNSSPAERPIPSDTKTVREVVLDVMRTRGFEPWPIPVVIAAVQERKPEAQPPNIRLTLRRLQDAKILMRDQHGNYRLDPQRHPRLVSARYSLHAGGSDEGR